MDEGTFKLNILKIDVTTQNLIKDSALFRRSFIQWRNQREKTIQVVEDLGKKIEKIHLASNAARSVGSAVSLVGGITSIAGIALKLTGHDTASTILRNGSFAQLFGTATSTSAFVAEFGMTKSVERQIKEVLEKDKELMEIISKWVHRSIRLNSLVQEIFGYDIQSQLLLDVLEICYETLQLVDAACESSDEIITAIEKQIRHSNVLQLPYEMSTIVLNIMERICDNPKLIKPVKNICNILINNCTLREMSLLGLKFNFMKTMFISGMTLSILTAFSLPTGAFTSGISQGTCQIVGIALDVVTVIFSVKNIQNSSKYSEKLKDLRYLLKEELREFDADFQLIYP